MSAHGVVNSPRSDKGQSGASAEPSEAPCVRFDHVLAELAVIDPSKVSRATNPALSTPLNRERIDTVVDMLSAAVHLARGLVAGTGAPTAVRPTQGSTDYETTVLAEEGKVVHSRRVHDVREAVLGEQVYDLDKRRSVTAQNGYEARDALKGELNLALERFNASADAEEAALEEMERALLARRDAAVSAIAKARILKQ